MDRRILGTSRYLRDTIKMAATSECRWNDCGLFAEVAAIAGVELRWTQWREKCHPTYLLHTALEGLPVMWVRLNYHWRPFPTQIRCRAFRGTLENEWDGPRPSFLGLVTYGLLSVFGVPYPYRQYQVLRSVDDHGIIAIQALHYSRGPENWRADITVQDTEYQIRKEHLPARMRILYNGDRIIAIDGDGEVITAEVFQGRPERSRMCVHRAVKGVEAILAFLFIEAREMERNTSD